MFERPRGWLLRLLRVPPEPVLPADARQLQVFRAGRGYYRYKLVLWAIGQVALLIALLSGFFWIARIPPIQDEGFLGSAFRIVEVLAWVGYAVQLPLSFAIVKLDFDMRWYILSDRSLRIREGILFLREKTMTFANIQQISVRQNPVQRFFEIADVQVRSAGGGGGEGQTHGAGLGESMHEAWFRGVDNAETIRAAVQARARLHRDAGLGDPDDVPSTHAADLVGAIAAARELHVEARLLRETVSPPANPARLL